jgi:ABC-2 type transport system ATP-binding protein
MNTSVRGTAAPATERDVAGAVRTLIDRLDGELRHPDLSPPLRGLAVRGVTLATGWSIDTWRERVDGWYAAAEKPGAHTDTGEWVKRLRKLRSFLATAGRESRHLDADAAADPQARALFGAEGQDVVTTAIDWLTTAGPPDTGPATAAVVVTDLHKRYGDVTAVYGVSLTIPTGRIFGLLGPNSAGKTTLVECVEGIRTPDSGEVTVLGLRHDGSARDIRTRTGIQLQQTGFYDLLTLRETLDLYASFYPRPVDVDALMTRLNIGDKAKTLVKDLSGGIHQRLSLGVALVNDPELVFLDEPTTGLDPQARRVIWDVVRTLRDDGRTVVLTTHYMDEAEQLCDTVAIMTAGRIRVQGSPAGLIARHVGDSVVELAPSAGFDAAAARALPGVRGCVTQGDRFVLRSDDPAALLRTILALPDAPVEARIRRGTLEDVFLAIAETGEPA